MTVSIVGLGSSAKDWHKIPCDLSIGVNDALKWGKDPDQLVLINFERKFTVERLKLIKATKGKVWTHTSTWKKHFPKAEVIRLTPFVYGIHPGLIYCSKTSPLVAMSLAYKQGANDLILWGVEFTNHKSYLKGTKQGDYEIAIYKKFIEQLKKKGVNVWLGAKGTAFDNYLPVYECQTIAQ
jgi:hypothetical protein